MGHLTLEHIDTIKGELVCGLKNQFNEILANSTYNERKNNRFVPYRVCEYPAPVSFGDTAEFLIEGQWVICEFGGITWWAESNRIGCGPTKGNDWERTNFHRNVLRQIQSQYVDDPRVVAGRLRGARSPASAKVKASAKERFSKPLQATRLSDGHVFLFFSHSDAISAIGGSRKSLRKYTGNGLPYRGYIFEAWPWSY